MEADENLKLYLHETFVKLSYFINKLLQSYIILTLYSKIII